NKAFASKENLDYWMPVDWYNGGMEHTTLHLLYSRFWGKFLYDIGVLPTSEPYQKRTSHGMILGADNEKMSKSRGNVVNPDEIVDKYGADTFRVYEMFIGPFDQAAAWNTEGLMGIFRFLNRVLNVGDKVNKKSVLNEDQQRLMHKTIMGVSQKIETMRFNTSISDLMTYTNSLLQMDSIPLELFKVLCILLNPFAPHLTSEMWEKVIGGEKQISEQPWPKFEAKLAQDEHVTMAIQINGKMRDTLAVERGISKETVLNLVKQNEKLNKYIEGKEFRRVIFVPDKILNIVV
ncbi:class I tRNA ligase family protein, partial [bacterium]|nr:class I tRNA ligase family protein [bacterium]